MFFEEIDNKDGQILTVNLENTLPATAANYGAFYTALAPCEVMIISERHGTAGTDGGAVTLQIEKLASGTAKGGGTNLLTTAFDLKSTINTPVFKETKDFVAGTYTLIKGNALAIKVTGTPTAVADLQVSLMIKRRGKGDYRI